MTGDKISNLKEALDLLEYQELKTCAKSLKGIKMTNVTTKSSVIEAIFKHVRSSQSIKSHFHKSSSSGKKKLKSPSPVAVSSSSSSAAAMEQVVLKE